jgi:hypothetical protein
MSFLISRSTDAPEGDAERRRQKQEFNEFQYASHVAQERLRQFYMLGKGRRAEKIYRDHGQALENHWFSGGVVPDSHVVGSASPATANKTLSIVHPLTGDQLPSNSAAHHSLSSPASSPISVAEPKGSTQPQPTPGRAERHWDPETPQSGGSKIVPSPFTMRESHTPHTLEKAAASPPFAEHYPTEQAELDAVAVPHFKNGLPRGILGIDFETGRARDAQRIVARLRQEDAAAARKEKQRQLKAALDAQVEAKARRRAQEWEAEATHVYGEGLRVGWDADTRAGARRQQHRNMTQTWARQAAERNERSKKEDEYYAPAPEDWAGMRQAMDEARQREVAARAGAGQEWLQAWQEHQAVEGAIRKAAAVEQTRREMMEIGPSIANYSERILLAERQKKEDQAMYSRAIELQVAEKRQRQQKNFAEEFSRDIRQQQSGEWPY